ncbi:Ger(x)C family spore germination protein [Bacillus tianshenii]|nr:Ger(x)C family spore germination protein [Bacillus tianshenii]
MKKWQTTLLFILCLTLLTGCWNKRELNDLGVAVAVGIDKTEDENFKIIVQLINPGEVATQTPTTRPPVSTYEIEGESVFEAFRKLTIKSPRKIYLSQLRLIVLGEKLAEEGIQETLDFLYRDHEMRTSFFLMVAKDEQMEDILNVLTSFEKIPANKVLYSLQASETNWAPTKGVNLDDVVSAIMSKGSEPVLTGIYISGVTDGSDITNVQRVNAPTQLTIDNLAIFKNDELVGWLSEDESKGYNYVKGNVHSTIVTVPCHKDNGIISVEMIRTAAESTAILKDNKPFIKVKITGEGNVGDVECKIDLTKDKTLKAIEKKVNNDIKDKINAALKTAQQDYKSDIFGFGEEVRRSEPKYWHKVEDNWSNIFAEMEVEVDVEIKIRRTGTIIRSIEQ